VVSHNAKLLERMCTATVVLEDGIGTYFGDVHEALEVHRENLRRPPSN